MPDRAADPPDLSPPLPDPWTPELGVRLWMEAMHVSEQFLLAGLRREIGPDGDLRAAYRRWYEAHMEEHDRMMLRMMAAFNEALRNDAG